MFGGSGLEGPNLLSAGSEKAAVRSEQGGGERVGEVGRGLLLLNCSTPKVHGGHQSGMSGGHSRT